METLDYVLLDTNGLEAIFELAGYLDCKTIIDCVMLRVHGRLLLWWRIFDSGLHVVIGLSSHRAGLLTGLLVVQFFFQFMLYPA